MNKKLFIETVTEVEVAKRLHHAKGKKGIEKNKTSITIQSSMIYILHISLVFSIIDYIFFT